MFFYAAHDEIYHAKRSPTPYREYLKKTLLHGEKRLRPIHDHSFGRMGYAFLYMTCNEELFIHTLCESLSLVGFRSSATSPA